MTEEGCWHDHETNGIQCLCQKDFCNSPRNLWTSDPTKPPIDGLKMLKRNPFVDYGKIIIIRKSRKINFFRIFGRGKFCGKEIFVFLLL